MKRSAILTFLSLAVLAACVKDEARPAIQFEGDKTPSFEFASSAGSLTMTFNSKLDWTATTSEPWVILDKTEGSSGDVTVTVSVEANETAADRSAWITILSVSRAATLNKTLKVTQKMKPKPQDPEGDEPPGDVASTAFTKNCTEIGAYTGTDGDSPVCATPFGGFQYAYGFNATSVYFRYVDFSKGEFNMITIDTPKLNLGSTYKVSCGKSDNGSVTEDSSSSLTFVCRRDGLGWFEDKTSKTGYIIPIEK